MRVTMLEDRRVTTNGVDTIDAAAGETYEMGPGVAASLVDQGAAEFADGDAIADKADGDSPENQDAGDEPSEPAPAAKAKRRRQA